MKKRGEEGYSLMDREKTKKIGNEQRGVRENQDEEEKGRGEGQRGNEGNGNERNRGREKLR